ncbi:MAG: hypothetical protein ACREQ5_35595, partial [Candidatus Dormibacteria bacterium]
MEEKLLPINIPPGFYRDGTRYQAKGRWADGNLVRFFQGAVRPVGGWQTLPNASGTALAPLAGVPRAIAAWRSADGTQWVGVATTTKLYIIAGGTAFDITPSGFTSLHQDAWNASGAGEFGNLNFGVGPFGTGATITLIKDPDTWQLAVFGEYLVGLSTSDGRVYVWQGDTGLPAATPTWGCAFTGSLVTNAIIAASATSFPLSATTLTGTILAGQQFVISGVTYVAQSNATAVANVLTVIVQPAAPAGGIASGTAVSGTNAQAPTGRAVFVTPERFLVVLGANADVRQVSWAAQETFTVWNALVSNNAGNFELSTNGRLMAGRAA